MPLEGDPFALYGKRIIHEHHSRLLKQLPPFRPDTSVPNPFDISDGNLRFLPQLKVGIIGAGVGGLYTALMLDSLGIPYDIIESSDRTGGRLSTYKFKGGDKYDYYEAGAMRFPLPFKDEHGKYKDGPMKRLAELVEYGPLNKGSDPLKDRLIPFYFSARKGSKPGFYYINDIIEDVSDKPKGSFNAEAMNVEAEYAKAGADAILQDVINPFARMIVNDIVTGTKKGWEVLKANDLYSVRGYMASKYRPSDNLSLPPEPLPIDVVNWLELLETSTGGYDRGLTESVLETVAFGGVTGTDYTKVDWKCFEGGTQNLSRKMEEYITSTGVSIQFKKRVTAIGQGNMVVALPRGFPWEKLPPTVKAVHHKTADVVVDEGRITAQILDDVLTSRTTVEVPCITVRVNDNEIKKYSHVICTIPLPVLRTIDLTDAGLNVMQKNALRALDYGPSIKIGLLFTENWWFTKLGIIGGQTYTDLPIRTVVYPSYGADSPTPPKALLASYTWTTDAFRLSAFASIEGQEELKELVLRNLAQAHSRRDPSITYEYLKERCVAIHAQDWNTDVHTMGGYGSFSPGEYDRLYSSLNFPAGNNRLHFVGEALSTRHAWVVGALDSAWKAVYQYLKLTGQDDKIPKFKELWGENLEWTCNTTIIDPDQCGEKVPDLLDQHLGIVKTAIDGGVIPQL